MPHQANRRMPLSCEPCRERKIRCPRRANQGRGPCETCVRRGIPPSECVYLKDLYGKRSGPRPYGSMDASPRTGDAGLLERISKLEKMMQAQNTQASNDATGNSYQFPSPDSVLQPPPGNVDRSVPDAASSPDISSPPSHPPPGKLVYSKSGHVRYVPLASKSSSVLRGVPTMHHVEADLDEYAAGDEMPFSMSTSKMDDLLAPLPPISHCSRLKDIYFNVFAPLFHILHDPSFNTEYSRFRDEPRTASLSWLALLYSILSIAVIASPDTDSSLLPDLGQRKSTAENMSLLSAKYRRAAMSCLEADHWLWRHDLHTLQSLVLLIYGTNHTHGQSWALLGTARNIAVAIGCHQDPEAFDLDTVAVEERRRAWAGLNSLYTVQSTTMGHLDATMYPSNVKLPLDVDDDQITAAVSAPTSSRDGPSQMSYLILKFQLYETCSKICSRVFGQTRSSSYDITRELDMEISSQQEVLNCKYLIDTAHAPLPDYHAAHLNILFGYSHQLMLLLHRPILMQRDGSEDGGQELRYEDWSHSRDRCVESSRALIGIHKMLQEDDVYRPYRWYNRGLGSFHAFHAVICLAYVLATSDDIDFDSHITLRRDLDTALAVFDQIERSGMSTICKKATPIIRKLLVISDNAGTSHRGHCISPGSSMAPEALPNANSNSDQNTMLDVDPAELSSVMRNLGSQPWLSPSCINWVEWETAADVGRTAPVF